MKKQSTGGLILYNLSKQAINPGKNFGPYGLAKSTTLFLMKQYALECGEYNIRVNGINADRIESGLLTKELINQRATSRGLSKEKYLSNNLLNKQVLADDVAEALCAGENPNIPQDKPWGHFFYFHLNVFLFLYSYLFQL